MALALINIVQRLVVLVVITLRPKDVLACNTRGTPSPAQSVATMLRCSSSAMLHALDCTGPKTGLRARQDRTGQAMGELTTDPLAEQADGLTHRTNCLSHM